MDKQSKIRVLIVDDHPMVCEGLTSMLTTPEVEVVEVAHSVHRKRSFLDILTIATR